MNASVKEAFKKSVGWLDLNAAIIQQAVEDYLKGYAYMYREFKDDIPKQEEYLLLLELGRDLKDDIKYILDTKLARPALKSKLCSDLNHMVWGIDRMKREVEWYYTALDYLDTPAVQDVYDFDALCRIIDFIAEREEKIRTAINKGKTCYNLFKINKNDKGVFSYE